MQSNSVQSIIITIINVTTPSRPASENYLHGPYKLCTGCLSQRKLSFVLRQSHRTGTGYPATVYADATLLVLASTEGVGLL